MSNRLLSVVNRPVLGLSYASDQVPSACVWSVNPGLLWCQHVSHVVNIPGKCGSAESERGLMGLFNNTTINAPIIMDIQVNEN